jgi:putative nucleotidyltransferase with HDIG domain
LSDQVKKILVVEDDDVFRGLVVKTLKKLKHELFEASNGKDAKELLLLEKIDLVISDIQMPHVSGLDLLNWIKTERPIPVILMTGFSKALETREAHEVGADDFLAKPFREAQLFELVTKYLGEKIEPPAPPVDLDPEFCRVSIADFISEKATEYNIFIRISNTKYIKIAHSGGKISDERIKAYQDKGIQHVYVKREDFSKIVGFNLGIARVVGHADHISQAKKLTFMKHAGNLILENVFVNGVDKGSVQYAKDFIETSMGVMTDDPELFGVLDILSNHADFVYAHSLGVSAFAVMIGRELGWHSAPVLFRLSMGGLFHDIGKKEIEKQLLEKPRVQLTQQERGKIESHPTRGKEILQSMKTVPSEVIAIVYEHHEDALGQGFPRGIGPLEIHPLAKVVHVANIFCEYAVKYRADMQPISPLEAIAMMEGTNEKRFDKAAFGALKKLIAKR